MKLRNILLVVENIEISKSFYKEIFGLDVIRDFGENVMLTEGLVLQQRDVWEAATEHNTCYGGADAALYFEESGWDSFVERVNEKAKMTNVSFRIMGEQKVNSWGKRVLRICDPDGHIIEVAEK